jgi:hypothetical protein
MVLPGISSPNEINRVSAGTLANGTAVTFLVTELSRSGAKTIHAAHINLVPLLRAVDINAPFLFGQKINYMTAQTIDYSVCNHSEKSIVGVSDVDVGRD